MSMSKTEQDEINAAVGAMTLKEKAHLTLGKDSWTTSPCSAAPSFRVSDGPHGMRVEPEGDADVMSSGLPATCFPAACALAASFDRELVEGVGEALGEEASNYGVDIVLGPGVNIKRSPLCGRNFEYFSEDPLLAGELGAAMVRGLRRSGVDACVKHYCCNNQETRRMLSNSCVDERTMRELYLEPFRISVEKSSPAAVMTSYNLVNGEYAQESVHLVRDVLRGEFGFDGIVISDWGAINDRAAALKASLDLEMPGDSSETDQDIVRAVKTGALDEKALDKSVARLIGYAKKRAKERVKKSADFERNFAVASETAARCAVLIKNEDKLLPFSDKERFAVIGAFAKGPRYQGTGSSKINSYKTDCLLDALDEGGVKYVYSEGCNADGSTNDELIKGAREAAKECDKVLLVLGLPDTYESEGFDRSDMSLPDGMLKLADSVLSENENTAVLLLLGSPVELPFEQRTKAIMCMYLAGAGGGSAAARLVLGKASPSGRLPETWPRKLGDCASSSYYNKGRKCTAEYREGPYVGYRYFEAADIEPMFRFGAGLGYTAFSMSPLRADKTQFSKGDKLKLSLDVKNIGKMSGAQVIELFVKRRGAKYPQLKEFGKVFLLPGEQRTPEFELDWRAFSVWDDGYKTLSGEYEIYATDDGTRQRGIVVNVEGDIHDEPELFDARQAPQVSDGDFYERLGFKPSEPPDKPFTLNTPIKRLRGRFVGEVLWSAIESNALDGRSDESTKLMIEKSVGEMPLRAIAACSKGALKMRYARAIIDWCNGRPLASVRKLFGGR